MSPVSMAGGGYLSYARRLAQQSERPRTGTAVDDDPLTPHSPYWLDRYGDYDPGSGFLAVCYFTAPSTKTVSKVVTATRSVASTTPTLCRIGLYVADHDGALLSLAASTANDTSLWGSTFTVYEKDFSADFAMQAGQRYALGTLFVGADCPHYACYLGSMDAYHFPRVFSYNTAGGLSDLPASQTDAQMANGFGQAPWFVLGGD